MMLRRPRRRHYRRFYDPSHEPDPDYIGELDRYYDPHPDPDPFPWAIVIIGGMAVASILGGVWLVREIKEPPDWMTDWKAFIGSPMGIVTVGLLALCFLVGLAYALPKIKGALSLKK